MNSIFTQALGVVAAARTLDIHQAVGIPGLYRLGIRPDRQQPAFRDLALAIEAFDRATGHEQSPAAALAAVMGYGVDAGADISGMIKCAAEAGMSREFAGEVAKELEAAMRLVPKPGEIGPPDDPKEDTADLAAIRSRRPSTPKVPPKFSIPDDEPFTSMTLPSLGLGGGAGALEAAAAILRPRTRGAARSESDKLDLARILDPKNESLSNDDERISSDEYDNELLSELDDLSEQLAQIMREVGHTEELRGLSALLSRTRDRVELDRGILGSTVRIEPGVVKALIVITRRIRDTQHEFGIMNHHPIPSGP